MKGLTSTVFLIAFGLVLTLNALSQTRLFEKYRFEKGGYTLVGIRSESDKNALAESLGDFYTEDVAVLNAVKKAWVFRRPSPMYACGYHYEIILLKDGKEIDSHGINLNCHELTTENGSLYFDTRLLSMFKNRFKKLYLKTNEFDTLIHAREFWAISNADKDFIYAYAPKWMDFEGSFDFLYKCLDPKGKCFEQRDKYMQQVSSEISKAFPKEKIQVGMGGAIGEDLIIEVQSSRVLYDKFDLYKLDRNSEFYGKWRPYTLNLYSYWKTK